MKINITCINDEISNKFRQMIRRRILKLETFNPNIISARVLLKNDNRSKDKSYHTEVKLSIRGYDLIGKSKAGNMESALTTAVESLRKRLVRKKTEKLLTRRNRRKVLQGG